MTNTTKNARSKSRGIAACLTASMALASLGIAGCSNQSGLFPQPTPVTVNISAPANTIPAGSTITVTGSASTGSLVWEAYGNGCTNSSYSCGSFDTTSGTTVHYTAPPTTPGGSSEAIVLRATSTTTLSIFSEVDITITPVSVAITSPTTTTQSVKAGSTLNIAASTTTLNSSGIVVTDPNGVTWTLSGSGCSGTGCGTLSNVTSTSVTYNAPATAGTTAVAVTVTAASVTDPGETAVVSITIPPAVIVTITPAGSTNVPDGGNLALSASTTNDPNNSGVTWSLTCTIGGTASTTGCGSLSSITPTSVVYSAPAAPAGALVASVKATSVYTPTISSTEVLNIPPAPVITITPPSSTTVFDNTSLTLHATVANDINNAGITWTYACTINGTATTGSSCGTLSGASNSATGTPTASSVTYNAPPAPPNAIAITITATSNANANVVVTQSLNVPSAPVITINSPAQNTSVAAGATQPVSATVTNDSNGDGVKWTLTCNTGNSAVTTGSACGTIPVQNNTATTSTTTASTFTYAAPATAAANPVDVTVTGVSNLLPTSTATLALIVPGANPVTLSVTPGSATVADGATQTLTANVGNDSTNAGVSWSLSCTVNSTPVTTATGATCGTLSTTSSTSSPYYTIYTAPAYPEYALTAIVTATSNAATTVSSSASLSVAQAPPLSIAITPQPTSPNTVYYAQSGVAVNLTAVVTNDQATPGATWTVAPAQGFTCPTAGCGTFGTPTITTTAPGQTTTTIAYTPPPNLVAALPVVLTATSNSETNVTATLNVTAETAITFSPNILGYAYAGQPAAFTQTVTVTGGTTPYTSITAANVPSWLTATPNLTNGTITFSGTPPVATASSFTSVTGGSYSTTTALGTGSTLVTISATDSTPAQPLTGTSKPIVTAYNPNEGAGTVGPNNALMTGTYAFYGTGYQDQAGSSQTAASTAGYPDRLAIIGSITTDGGGNITGGEVDVNNSTGYAHYQITGSYNVEPNQIATITLLLPTTPVTPVTLVAALGGLNSSNIATTGQFIEYDDSTGSSGNRVSGELSIVSSSVLSQSSSPLSGSFAFGAQGATPGSAYNSTCEAAGSCGPAAEAGQIVLTSGVVTGTEDIAYGILSASQVSLSGSLAGSGATDANGRMTGTITAANASSYTSWPSDYAFYSISASAFYFMSTDSFKTTTMFAGKALQQNLTDIQSTPLSGPLVLFGNAFASQSVTAPATTNGGMAAAFNLKATPSSATAGTLAGATSGTAGVLNGYTTGTSTAQTKFTAISGISYTVTPSSGRVALSGGTFTGGANTSNYLGLPVLYLADTNSGFAVTTPTLTNTYPTGMLVFYPQTGTNTLNAGNYTVALFKEDVPTSVTEAGVFTVPSAVGTSQDHYSGQMFLSYNKENEESNGAGAALVDLTMSSTTGDTNYIDVSATGAVSLNVQPNGVQACNGGVGYIISPTSFVCLPSGAGQSQEPLYGVQ